LFVCLFPRTPAENETCNQCGTGDNATKPAKTTPKHSLQLDRNCKKKLTHGRKKAYVFLCEVSSGREGRRVTAIV
jgi:hypothetical protein